MHVSDFYIYQHFLIILMIHILTTAFMYLQTLQIPLVDTPSVIPCEYSLASFEFMAGGLKKIQIHANSSACQPFPTRSVVPALAA